MNSFDLRIRAKKHVLDELSPVLNFEHSILQETEDKAFYFPGQEIATMVLAFLGTGGLSAALSAVIVKHIEAKKSNIKFKTTISGDFEVECSGASKDEVFEMLEKVSELFKKQKPSS